MRKVLLSIIELGGYPDFTPLYESLGYEVATVNAGRKALAEARRLQPLAVVAEFNLQRDFRDRTSTLESLFATLQRQSGTKIVVFHDPQDAAHLQALRARFPGFTALSYPIDQAALKAAL